MGGSLLTRAIEAGFKNPIWTKVASICDGAELLILPLTVEDYQAVLKEFGICSECNGFPQGEKPCQTCQGGSSGKTSDRAYRLAMMKKLVAGGRNLKADDPVTGDLVEIEYSEVLRDALADVPAAFGVIMRASLDLIYHARDEAKKDSPPPPSVASPTANGPGGTPASASSNS